MEIKLISLILNNQDPQSQNPNYETSNTKHCNRPKFKPKLLPDNVIPEGINSLYSK